MCNPYNQQNSDGQTAVAQLAVHWTLVRELPVQNLGQSNTRGLEIIE